MPATVERSGAHSQTVSHLLESISDGLCVPNKWQRGDKSREVLKEEPKYILAD